MIDCPRCGGTGISPLSRSKDPQSREAITCAWCEGDGIVSEESAEQYARREEQP